MHSEAALNPAPRGRAWEITRWLLLVPACIAAWYAAYRVGMHVYDLVEQAVCPLGDRPQVRCLNQDIVNRLFMIHCASAAFSALAVEAAAVFVAPRCKRAVLWWTFAFGSVVALVLYLPFWPTAWLFLCLGAIGAGLIGALLLHRRLGSGLKSGVR